MLVEALINNVINKSDGEFVADVRLGLGYTAVRLSGGGFGIAATIYNE